MVGAEYIVIEHIGSTSVLGPAAKPNIDIIIEVPNAENAEKAKEALIYEPPAAEHYKCYGDGGIRGRISMKLADRSLVPDQSVYIIDTTNPEGRLAMRCHRDLRNTLRIPKNEQLKIEYGQITTDLASISQDGVEYGQRKNPIVRRILRVAGWTDADIDKKQNLDYRISGADLPY